MLEEFKDNQVIALNIIKKELNSKRISHAYLIETNNYIDNKKFALGFAKSLLCPYNYINNNLCGKCTQCQKVDKNIFSEFKVINSEGLAIKKEQLNELQKEFSVKSVDSSKKVYIINHAELLNDASANTLLKFLEEPADNIIAILVTDNSYQVIDTIRSRCQIISLNSNSNEKNDLLKLNLLVNSNNGEINKELIEVIINFISNIEFQKIEAILNVENILVDYLKDRGNVVFMLNFMILYYKDILNFLIGRNLEVFNDYESDIMKMSEMNNILSVNKKISIIRECLDNIMYNENINLMLDKMIIDFNGGLK